MEFVVEIFDSKELAQKVKSLLYISREYAKKHGHRSVNIQKNGSYQTTSGETVFIKNKMLDAKTSKQSIPPEQKLNITSTPVYSSTRIRICNMTTLTEAKRFYNEGKRVLTLNFANGITPGGGFLTGSRAQEETLCFASTLYDTIKDDPFYNYNLNIPDKSSSDYAILSKSIVFSDEQYHLLDSPWEMDVLTAAAPICYKFGSVDKEEAQRLLHNRIRRVYEIAVSNGYEYLLLGAWGCGAFGNDPYTTAQSFRYFLEHDFKGYFKEISFAIADWSEERRFLRPFCNVFKQKQL